MKRILSLNTRDLATSKKEGGCGECQTSCQSAGRIFLSPRPRRQTAGAD